MANGFARRVKKPFDLRRKMAEAEAQDEQHGELAISQAVRATTTRWR